MLKKRNQKGFTLIEIIAVLVILGILAAIAIPKYLDMQKDAKNKAVQGAVSSLISHTSMNYSQSLLNGAASATTYNPPAGTITVGDFQGTIGGTNGDLSATVTVGPTSGYMTEVDATYATKSFKLF